jgi:uncharacterized protein (TIGR02217 family)
VAFHEVQFPPSISYGATGGPTFKTTVFELSGGAEQRNIDWSMVRAKYDVSHGLKTQAQLDQLLAFFYARKGRAYGFRYKDWADYQITTPQSFFTTNGTLATFQLAKLYSDAQGTYVRNITKPVAGTLHLYDNGVATADYTVNLTTGIVTLGNTTKATTGHVIGGTLEFDVPVRFDIDEMRVNIKDFEMYGWDQVTLVEVRDI